MTTEEKIDKEIALIDKKIERIMEARYFVGHSFIKLRAYKYGLMVAKDLITKETSDLDIGWICNP